MNTAGMTNFMIVNNVIYTDDINVSLHCECPVYRCLAHDAM